MSTVKLQLDPSIIEWLKDNSDPGETAPEFAYRLVDRWVAAGNAAPERQRHVLSLTVPDRSVDAAGRAGMGPAQYIEDVLAYYAYARFGVHGTGPTHEH